MITMYSACRVRESRTKKKRKRTVYRKVRDAIDFIKRGMNDRISCKIISTCRNEVHGNEMSGNERHRLSFIPALCVIVVISTLIES
jgi:hypothetical protein